MATVSNAQTFTLEFLIEEVNDFMANITGSRFDKREVINAINNAIRVIPPKWTVKKEDKTSLDYDEDTHQYTIPTEFEYLSEVYLSPIISTDLPYRANRWRQLGDQLFFETKHPDYDGNDIYLYGEGAVSAIDAVKGTTGVADGTTSFDDANATFSTDGVAVNDTLFIVESGNNDAAVGEYNVDAVASETELTLDSAPTSASNCVYIVVGMSDTTDAPYEYVLFKAAYFLYLGWWQKGVSKDVDASAKKAQYLNEQAFLALEENKQRRMTRRR